MKGKLSVKSVLTYLGPALLFLLLSAVFFAPVFKGKQLVQPDMLKVAGMLKEQKDFYEKTGEKTFWCSSMFCGMPSYYIYSPEPATIIYPLGSMLTLGRSDHVGIVFLYMLAAYIALMMLGCKPWLSVLGAIGIAFSTYNIIIIEAGHITKSWSVSMMFPILIGMLLCLKRKYIAGGLLFLLALSLQIGYNHVQITYYTMLAAVVLGFVYFLYAIREKTLKPFFTSVGVLVAAAALAFVLNASLLLPIQEYVKYTMRGGSELTISPDQEPNSPLASKEGKNEAKQKGLDLEYAFNWSYGKAETFTLLVPGIYGGSSNEKMSKDSEFYKNYRQEHAPLYWGDQPFTSGPVYFGAITCFLFILGLFVVKGPEKWWLLIGSFVFIVIALGSNLMPVNKLLFDYLPLYNKFRTPSMSLVGANVLMVLMAILAIKAITEKGFDKLIAKKAIYYSAGITAGLCLFFLMFGGSLFSFTGAGDAQYQNSMQPSQFQMFLDILMSDRKSLLQSDALRSLLFIVLAAAALWLFVSDRLKDKRILLGIVTLLILLDLWSIDRRYINDGNYKRKSELALKPTEVDLQIKQLAEQNQDKEYRVFNMATNPFNDSYTSAFHHSIGGYHAAKLSRYQDLIDFHLSKRNMQVINMLNTRYFIIPNAQGAPEVYRNPAAFGNAWFVQDIKFVNSPDEEILALNDSNLSRTAVVHQQFKEYLRSFQPHFDSLARIELISGELYNPSKLTYKTTAQSDQFAVFSEIYYQPDWKAFIDGKPADYIQVNYLLRGMLIPAGTHEVEFRIVPTIYKKSSILSISGSVILVLLIIALIAGSMRKKKAEGVKV